MDVIPNGAAGRVVDLLPPSGVAVIARLDGAKMVESHDVFSEFSATLRFPAYFGWNWAALSDCLRDLSWQTADRYLVVIDKAEEVLLSSSEERDLLFRILARAAKEWVNPLGKPDGNGVLFKVVLVCRDEAVEALRMEVDKY